MVAAGAAGLSTAVACVAAAAAGAGDAGVGAASDHFWKTVACGRFLYQRF